MSTLFSAGEDGWDWRELSWRKVVCITPNAALVNKAWPLTFRSNRRDVFWWWWGMVRDGEGWWGMGEGWWGWACECEHEAWVCFRHPTFENTPALGYHIYNFFNVFGMIPIWMWTFTYVVFKHSNSMLKCVSDLFWRQSRSLYKKVPQRNLFVYDSMFYWQ